MNRLKKLLGAIAADQLGVSLMKTLIGLTIMGMIGGIVTIVLIQFMIRPTQTVRAVDNTSNLRNLAIYLKDDVRQAQAFNPSETSPYGGFVWTDFTKAIPKLNVAYYQYSQQKRAITRGVATNGIPSPPLLLTDLILKPEDVSFLRLGNLEQINVVITQNAPTGPVVVGTIGVKSVFRSAYRPAQGLPLPGGGYAMFAKGAINWATTEGDSAIIGDVHTNGRFTLTTSSDSFNYIAGTVGAAGGILEPGKNNFIDFTNATAPIKEFPVSYTLNDFDPIAFQFSGDVNLNEVAEVWADAEKSILKPGVYYATGRITLSDPGHHHHHDHGDDDHDEDHSHVTGNVTFVADRIKIDGAHIRLTAFRKGVLFFATNSSKAIHIFGGKDMEWRGIFYAPNGEIDISGKRLFGEGSLYADSINWTGKGRRLDFSSTLFEEP